MGEELTVDVLMDVLAQCQRESHKFYTSNEPDFFRKITQNLPLGALAASP